MNRKDPPGRDGLEPLPPEIASLRPVLYQVALGLTRDPVAADDLVQDTLLVALTKPQVITARNPLAWLTTVLHNKFIDNVRSWRSKNVIPLARPEEVPAVADPEDQDSRPWEHVSDDDYRRAVAALPERFRIPYVLKTVDGWSYAQIAGHLGIGVNTVGTRIARARTRLRQALVRGQ